jgi:adenine-specific DNA-methyltransferase
MARKPRTSKRVETLRHEEASRRNIPTAEYQSIMGTEQQDPIQVAYERRNRDLDPQFVVQASPLYIQEKIHS